MTRVRWSPPVGGEEEVVGRLARRKVKTMRLEGKVGGEEEEEEEEEEEVCLVALMSAEHWCVCALNR